MTRYVIIGGGAVGGALAAGLHEAGVPVVLAARGAVLEAINRRGLRYTRPHGTVTVPLTAVPGPEAVRLTGDDILVLATKAQHASQALADWAWRPVADRPGAVAGDLPLVVVQNGLETERIAARRFATVLSGTVLVPARHVVPGEILTAAAPRTGHLLLGGYPYPGRVTDVAERVVADVRAAGWVARAVPDVSRWKAWKLAHNVTNAVGLFSGDRETVERVRRAAVAEAREVLAAAGYTLADPDREPLLEPELTRIDHASGYVADQQSTWQSFARGASSEVDYLNGEIALLARLHGLAAPVNTALQRVLGRSELAAEPPGTRGIGEVAAAAWPREDPAGTPRATEPAPVNRTGDTA